TAANATAANATATADDSTAESLLYIVVFLGLPIACGKSSITRELLKRLPNSASVSKEGGSKSEFKNKISVLVKDLNLKLMVVDKNHPDPNGAASTFALILEVLRYTQRPVRVLAVVPDKLDSYDIIECRIADRIGLTTSEAGGSTFIPGAKGLEGDKWRYAFRVNFYEPSLQFLNTFKKTSGALIVDIIQTSPEENASIIVNTLLSEELVGVPLSDIISPQAAYTYTGVLLTDIVGGAHVTLYHTSNGPTPEVINALIGQEVIVTYENYVKAAKGGKTISFWMVKSIHLQETGEELALSDSNLFHITDQAALRNTNSANAAMAKEVMREIRESDDSAKYESSRVQVLENGD
ncbi:MAG: hypothetical protein EBY83_08915, partial [Verrucomicrobia bacterium]|nr:hypothetical protein [Verrucomicrobiota bacterium]